jgi:hypothetical protein
MASYSSAANDVNLVQQNYRTFLLRVSEIKQDVDNGAGVQEIAPRVARLLGSIGAQLSLIRTLQDVVIPGINDASQNEIEALYNLAGEIRDNLNNLDTELRSLIRQARQNDQNRDLLETQPRNSAGQEVEEEAAAQEENASVQNPPVAPQIPVTPNGSNANDYEFADPANDFGPGGGGLITQKQTNPGGASNTDDAYDIPRETTATSSGVDDGRPPVSAEFLQQIEPTPNMLNGLTNMTYTISIYLLDRREFVDLIISQDKKLPSKQLIIQTGGAPLGERNTWFDLDFYIEDLNITSIVGTQEVGSAHNSVLMNFTVVEPNGITFLNRLNNACIEHTGLTAATTSELAQNYLMVIRWYGYDEAGNRVTADQIFKNATTTDQNAVAEKFIPFQIANITYKIRNQNVEYRVEATIPQTQIALSTARGSIPFNLQLVAPDVQTLLNGTFATALNEFDEGDFGDLEGNAAPTSKPNGLAGETVTQGLCEALNEHQQRLVNQGTYEVADIYEIELQELPGLKDAKLQKPGGADKKQAANKNSKSSAQQYLGSKLNYDKATRTYSVPAGQQIVQLIDLVMRSSSYITSQQNVIFDEKTGKIKAQQSKVQTVQWYRIRTQCTPIAYDNKRRDYAYRIKYTISAYQINTPRSPYYPPSAYRGTHKLYPYWFTGENTEVLDFEIDVNSNFLVTIGNDGSVDDSPQGRWPVKNSYGAPNASQQGGTKGSSIPAANLSDRLYYYADVANNKITIVGDPDWVQQTEVLYNEKINLGPFMDDGSVNYDGSEVLYEIRFNPVQDYDMTTGLSPVYENNTVKNLVGETNVAQESLVFAANRVESNFSKGAFTQTLHGTIREFEGATGGPTKGINRGNAKADENITVGSVYDTSVADIAAQQEADGLEQWPTSTTGNTPKSVSQPNRSIQLTPTGTKNFNVDKRLPFRDTEIGGQTVRVYGSERDLTKFVGEQAVQPKPGSTVISDDAGTEAVFGGVGGYGKGIG